MQCQYLHNIIIFYFFQEPAKKKETIEKESVGKPTNAGAGLKRPKRPRICRRLVVNCRKVSIRY